jgi:hypothetical protein
LVFPKPPTGTPVDKAREAKEKFLKLVRAYIKGWMFNDMARYQQTAINLKVPVFLYKANREDIIAYYSKLKLLPSVSPMHLDPAEWYPERHIAIFVDRDGKGGVMAPKILTVKIAGKFVTTRAGDLSGIDNFSAHDLGFNSFFVVNPGKDNLNPVSIAFAKDLSLIRQNFIILPKDMKIVDAIAHRDVNWQRYFERNTSITEAPKEDGTFSFAAKLSLEEFCVIGKATTEIVAP